MHIWSLMLSLWRKTYSGIAIFFEYKNNSNWYEVLFLCPTLLVYPMAVLPWARQPSPSITISAHRISRKRFVSHNHRTNKKVWPCRLHSHRIWRNWLLSVSLPTNGYRDHLKTVSARITNYAPVPLRKDASLSQFDITGHFHSLIVSFWNISPIFRSNVSVITL